MSLIDDVRDYLDQQGRAYTKLGEDTLVDILAMGSYSWWELTVEELPGALPRLIVFSLPAIIVPPNKRRACMQLICRINST
jgi:hypothetical protein